MKPQSHTSRLGSGEELSERTTSSKVRSETVDSILSAVAKKKVVISDKVLLRLLLRRCSNLPHDR